MTVKRMRRKVFHESRILVTLIYDAFPFIGQYSLMTYDRESTVIKTPEVNSDTKRLFL